MDDLQKYFDEAKKNTCKGSYSRFSYLAGLLRDDYPELSALLFDLLKLCNLEDLELEGELIRKSLTKL